MRIGAKRSTGLHLLCLVASEKVHDRASILDLGLGLGRTSRIEGKTYRVVVGCLNLSAHELPDESLETDDLVGGLERRAERQVQPDVAGIGGRVTNAENL